MLSPMNRTTFRPHIGPTQAGILVRKALRDPGRKIAVNGKMVTVNTLDVDHATVIVTGKFLRVARIKDEAHQEEIKNPGAVIAEIKNSHLKADLFTFDQKVPNSEPQYEYYHELDNRAVIKLSSYDDWWNHKIKNDARRMVRKALKCGIEVKAVP